jgi:hypothetical protein
MAASLPPRAQRIRKSPPAELQQRGGALLLVEAALRAELRAGCRDAVARA